MAELAWHFERAGVRGYLHARPIDTGGEVGLRPDDPVVLASMIKIPLVLEFARQCAAGQLEPTDRIRVRAADRLGGTGTAGCADDVELSLRDAALFALSVSDNSAADLLFDRVGLDNVRSLLAELGLTRTTVIGPPRAVLRQVLEDIGDDPGFRSERLLGTRALDPAATTSGTARELTALLALIWRDEAGPPEACRFVRELMARQVSWHRLGSAFGEDVLLAGKTGTLPGIRNEFGVVEYPDGGRYAVAVCTRVPSTRSRTPAVDAAIGHAARQAVEQLRG